MSSSIASSLLVASPALSCPFFNHSLILLVEHDASEGSFGFVLNKRSDLELDMVLAELEVPRSKAGRSIPVLIGGPVAPQTGWVLFERENGELPEDTLPVGEWLGLTASLDFFRELAAGHGPSRALLMLGYAGWGPGQLEAELREGSWLPVDLSREVLFETSPERKWRAALETLGIFIPWVVGRTGPFGVTGLGVLFSPAASAAQPQAEDDQTERHENDARIPCLGDPDDPGVGSPLPRGPGGGW